MAERRIIISGGGTGGHIFPAIAIANALKEADPATSILFVGATGKMEMEKVPAAGYKIVGLNITGLQRSMKWSNLMFPFKLLTSLMNAGKIIKNFKPHVAVGVGGYASGPLLYMASRLKIPCLIQEQNSYPGITNKLLASKVEKICVAYENMNRFFPPSKIILTGNPVREDMVVTHGKRDDAARFFNVAAGKPVLVVVGGSQGARSINIAVASHLNEIADAGIQLVWQCGKNYIEQARMAIANLKNSSGIVAFDFINRMDYAYALADVIISRAGASTVSELCIVGVPAILVPLPTAAEDHQTHNCKALVEKKAAILIKDADAGSLLVQEAIRLMSDTSERLMLSNNIKALAIHNAAKTIAGEVIRLSDKNIAD